MLTLCILLAAISDHVNGSVVGDASVEIVGVGSISAAQRGEITHLSSVKFKNFLPTTKASAVILTKQFVPQCPVNAIVVKQPLLAYARVSQLFEHNDRVDEGIHPTAQIDSSATIGENVRIGPYVNIAARVEVGDRVELGAGVSVGSDSVINTDSVVSPSVVIYHNVRMGSHCIVHANSVIGADGFGLVPDERGVLQRVAQLGGVRIGDDVLIGALCTIDRGAINDTVLEDGVKLDDHVHIGHNCQVGAHTILCGCAGLAGSVTLGRHCIIGGGVGIAGDGPLRLTDNVTISSMTFVGRDISEPGVYSGNVLHNKNSKWRRNAMRFNELDQLAKRLKRLEKMYERNRNE